MTNTGFNHEPTKEIEQAIKNVAQGYGADIFLIAGNLRDGMGHRFIEVCSIVSEVSDAQNCVLFLTTNGGSMDAAYRITRCIRNRYSRGNFILVVNGLCKSAGTLVALGADALVMTDHAELGPLDTQVTVRDEFGEQQSGLLDNDALRHLNGEVFNSFQEHLSKLLLLGNDNLTTSTALRVASELTLGLFGGIYRQIDPIRFGETARAIQVALEYGDRVKSSNVLENTLRKLATEYPSHGFVIDRREAEELFFNVYSPEQHIYICQLAKLLRPLANYYCLTTPETPILEYLNQGLSEHLVRLLHIFSNGDAESDDSEEDGVQV